MQVGISTACFYPTPTENTIELIKDTGVSLCEIFLETISEYDRSFCDRLIYDLEKYGIKPISCHGLAGMYEPMIFSDYQRRSRDCIAFFEKLAKATAQLGAKYITFHGNRYAPPSPSFDFASFAKTMDELCKIANHNGVYLAWENVSWCQSADPEFIARSLEYIKEDVRFTFDIKQAKRADISPVEYLKVMCEKLVNLHINDFDINNICLLPGQGTNNFSEIFSLLQKFCNYQGDCIIEVYGNNYKNYNEISNSVEFLRSLLQ